MKGLAMDLGIVTGTQLDQPQMRFGTEWSAETCFAKYQKNVGKSMLPLGRCSLNAL